MKIDLEMLERNSSKDLLDLKNFIDTYLRIKDEIAFIQVELSNTKGSSVAADIRKAFPKYEVFWKGEPGTIGTIYINIPRSDWNDELKAEISKFDSFVGHHVESRQMYVPKKDVEFPLEVQRFIDNRLSIMVASERAKGPRWDKYELERDYSIKKYIEDYFDLIDVVVKEWTTELRVVNHSEYAQRQLDQLSGYSIELN